MSMMMMMMLWSGGHLSSAGVVSDGEQALAASPAVQRLTAAAA